MTSLYSLLKSQPLWLLTGAAAALLVVLAVILWRLLAGKYFLKLLKRASLNPELAPALICNRYSKEALLRRSGLIERFIEKNGSDIIGLTSIDSLWVDNLVLKKRKKDFLRVLNYAPEIGLFKCFLLSLEKKALAPLLIKSLKSKGEFLYLHRLALSGKGEDFVGSEALEIFRDRLDGIREMTGDPEWAPRYFAVKILLNDDEDRSQRALWESFSDPHPLVRKTLAGEFVSEQREKLYSELHRLMVGDPVYEVRLTAWERIQKDFSDLYRLEAGKLKEEEICHLLELLRVDSKDDQDFALRNLESANLEFRFTAARYLEKCGVLERLCLETDLGDREGLERNFKLLAKASEVNVTSFLSCTEKTENMAAFYICARILAVNGNRKYITALARKVFNKGLEDNPEIYKQTLTAISQRGDEAALRLMEQELLKKKKDSKTAELILAAIPARGDQVFLETLISLLKDPGFPPHDGLRGALKIMPASLVLFELFPIIQAERARYAHQVRIEALKLLGEMEMHYSLQTILEQLPIFTLAEAKEFARVLAGFPRKLLINKVENLLAACDAGVRASLISILHSTEEKEFLKSIRKALKDADPEIRIASVWAIVDFADFRSLNQAFSMLRDPVERVRSEVARAFGSYGSDDVLERLKALLTDENEVASVKRAALVGLKNASSLKAVEILVARLEVDEELQGDIQAALAFKVKRKEVAALVEDFKDADPGLRTRITAVFKAMKEEGEEALVELLKEDILSLNPFIAEILDSTGYVESQIRKLSHRDSEERREAAEVLSLVGTESAFRGIVLAARDPDDEVRVKVIKALEKLETKEGKEILAALEGDGDKRVRKYTHWALERLKAKEL